MPLVVLDQCRREKIALDVYDVADHGLGGIGHRSDLLTHSLETPKALMAGADRSLKRATRFCHHDSIRLHAPTIPRRIRHLLGEDQQSEVRSRQCGIDDGIHMFVSESVPEA